VPRQPQARRLNQIIYSTQVRTARNVSGHRLAPACTHAQRRAVEQILARALGAMGTAATESGRGGGGGGADGGGVAQGHLKGRYYPLPGSTSGAHLSAVRPAYLSSPGGRCVLCGGLSG
jgi:hypothetical protein